MSRQSWPRQKDLPHTTKLSVRRLVRTTFGIVLCGNRGGHARATDHAKRLRQTRPGAHDRPWAHTTELAWDKGILS